MLKVGPFSPAKSLVRGLFDTLAACLLLGRGRGCSTTLVLTGRFLGMGRFFGWLRGFGFGRGLVGRLSGSLGNFIGLTDRLFPPFLRPLAGVGVGLPPLMRNTGVGGTGLGGVTTGVLGKRSLRAEVISEISETRLGVGVTGISGKRNRSRICIFSRFRTGMSTGRREGTTGSPPIFPETLQRNNLVEQFGGTIWQMKFGENKLAEEIWRNSLAETVWHK